MAPASAGLIVVLRIALRYGEYFAIAWLALFVRRWNRQRRENTAQSWPTVEGILLSGTVTPIKKTTRYLATVQYSYFVDEYRSGKYTQEFTREAEADDFVRQIKDKRVLIRYKESKPDVSCLETSMVAQIVALSPVRG
jgi:hypothetical protein